MKRILTFILCLSFFTTTVCALSPALRWYIMMKPKLSELSTTTFAALESQIVQIPYSTKLTDPVYFTGTNLPHFISLSYTTGELNISAGYDDIGTYTFEVIVQQRNFKIKKMYSVEVIYPKFIANESGYIRVASNLTTAVAKSHVSWTNKPSFVDSYYNLYGYFFNITLNPTNADVGYHTFELNINNSELNLSETYTIQVVQDSSGIYVEGMDINNKLSIVLPGEIDPQIYPAGADRYSYKIPAIDLGGEALSFSFANISSDQSNYFQIDSSTGAITYTGDDLSCLDCDSNGTCSYIEYCNVSSANSNFSVYVSDSQHSIEVDLEVSFFKYDDEPETDMVEQEGSYVGNANIKHPYYGIMNVPYYEKEGYAYFSDMSLGPISEFLNYHNLLTTQNLTRTSDHEIIKVSGYAGTGSIGGKWTRGVIPFEIVIPSNLSSKSTALTNRVQNAMDYYNVLGGLITFVPRNSGHTSYITFEFIKDLNSCHITGKLGRTPGQNLIKLDDSSCSTKAVAHEIGHHLGLMHEHTRPDRGTTLTYHEDNVKTGKTENFNKLQDQTEGSTFGTSYDLSSIMHYGEYDFGKYVNIYSETCKSAGSSFKKSSNATYIGVCWYDGDTRVDSYSDAKEECKKNHSNFVGLNNLVPDFSPGDCVTVLPLDSSGAFDSSKCPTDKSQLIEGHILKGRCQTLAPKPGYSYPSSVNALSATDIQIIQQMYRIPADDIIMFNAQNNNSFFIRRNDENGILMGAQFIDEWNPLGGTPLAGDFNGDKRADLALYNPNGEGYFYIRYNTDNNNPGFTRQTKYHWGAWGHAKAFTGDFNGDGKWDIGLFNPNQNDHFYIKYGDGRGSFNVNQIAHYWVDTDAQVFTGDFNGDGFWDIGHFDIHGQGKWYIRFGDGNGSFFNEKQYTWASHSDYKVFTGDFNKDGFTDIGFFHKSESRIYIRYNSQNLSDGGRHLFHNEQTIDWAVSEHSIPLAGDVYQ